jgi:hypothetical protein
VTQLTIALPPDLERRLSEEAEKRGQAVEEYARTVLEASVAAAEIDHGDPYAGLPRRSPEELDALARAQGVPLVVDVDDLVGDFWPEDETCDEFIAAIRELRREEVAPVADLK